jgi:hypothetical protein
MLVSPKGIIKYLKSLNLVLNAVFYLSPSLMRIRLYAPLRLRAVKIYFPYRRSLSSVMSGSGVRSLIVRSFNLR